MKMLGQQQRPPVIMTPQQWWQNWADTVRSLDSLELLVLNLMRVSQVTQIATQPVICIQLRNGFIASSPPQSRAPSC